MPVYAPKYNPERFREVLSLLRLSQTQLADELGMKQPTISAIMSGKSKDVSIHIREHLRNKYNINTDYIYNLSSEVYLNNSKEVLQNKIKLLEEKIEKQEQIIDLQFQEIKKLKGRK